MSRQQGVCGLGSPPTTTTPSWCLNLAAHPNQRHRLGVLLLHFDIVAVQRRAPLAGGGPTPARRGSGSGPLAIRSGCRISLCRWRQAQNLQQGMGSGDC